MNPITGALRRPITVIVLVISTVFMGFLAYPRMKVENGDNDAGLASYVSATDAQALEGFQALARTEGILPALEPAHVIGWLLGRPLPEGARVLVCLSGRGDKDLDTVLDALGIDR